MIAKYVQSDASPERSSYSIVFLSVRPVTAVANTTFGEARRFWGVFSEFAREKMVCGGTALLLGFLRFWVRFVTVNRGEFVVECVANAVC